MRIAAPSLAACLLASTPAWAEPCQFDASALKFAGAPAEQARCLLRPVEKWGRLGPRLTELPPTLATLLGTKPNIAAERLAARGRAAGLPASALHGPVSKAYGGAATAPVARYFVIHDTSAPWLGERPFPSDLDSNARRIALDGFLGPNAVAHAFIGRTGEVRFGHDFSVPWRATKRENTIGLASKGLFLHIENVQPRRSDPAGRPKNDAIAPVPGLSAAQYDRLALLYIVASVRAGQWLIPAFHAALDEGISDAHDDPQNFELAGFDDAIAGHLTALQTRD